MFEKGDKSCPICTEQMDLTDQQLKPCKCGYEICVWCWHHIMEMSEKDGTEGRCPACRTTYDKDRIVIMSANCQRVVAEMNSQQKKKMHKLKPKSTEGRKHLSDVRVIQRNLVYIIGLPLNLADEDLLQRREYFGRYGKVVKLSISRTSTGVIQHSANNSCCVYIMYSKEMEAVRCIQSVHCFVLDGRSLRACFGTTKYCHAWLRNVTCSNRECLYLHDFGSQEDSFTKDELVLAFARSRIPQIIGATNNLHRRAGNVLPPSIDELRNANTLSAARPIARSPLDINEDQIKGSSSFGNISNTEGLPPVASWVMRVSGSVSPVSSSWSPGSSNRIPEGSNDHQPTALGATGMEISPLQARCTESKGSAEVHSSSSLFTSERSKNYTSVDPYTSEMNNTGDLGPGKFSIRTSCSLFSCKDENPAVIKSSSGADFLEYSQPLDVPTHDKSGSRKVNDIQGLCSRVSSIGMHNHLQEKYSVPGSENSFSYNPISSARGQWPEANQHCSADISNMPASLKDIIVVDDLQNLGAEHSGCGKGNDTIQTRSVSGLGAEHSSSGHSYFLQQNDISHNIVGADSEHVLKRNEVDPNMIPTVNQPLHKGFGDYAADYPFVSVQTAGSFNSSMNAESEAGRKVNVSVISNAAASDMGESSIISNILSIGSDAWEDSFTLPQSLVKLLGESEERQISLKVPAIRKVHDKNQSRFSFARQDDFDNETSAVLRHVGDGVIDSSANYLFSADAVRSNDVNTGKLQPSFSSSNVDSNNFLSVSKGHLSTPPGFSVPSRMPPGFACHLGADQDFGNCAKLIHHEYAPPTSNIGTLLDFEFFDPAIVKVGKGTLADRQTYKSFVMRRNTFSQLNPYEDNSSPKLLAQQSLSLQNFKYTDHMGNKLSSNDDYRVSSRILDQFHVQPNNSSVHSQLASQQLSNSHPTNGHLAGWNDIKNFDGYNISDIMSSERMGYNRFVSSYENGEF